MSTLIVQFITKVTTMIDTQEYIRLKNVKNDTE